MTRSTHDDYLWDRSGTPDPFVAELEQVLSPLAHDPETEIDLRGSRRPARFIARAVPLGAAAILLVGVSIALVLMLRPVDAPWRIDAVTGAPRLADATVGSPRPLRKGAWLETDSATFLISPALRTPMASHVAAFGDEADATEAKGELGGEVMGFEATWRRLAPGGG